MNPALVLLPALLLSGAVLTAPVAWRTVGRVDAPEWFARRRDRLVRRVGPLGTTVVLAGLGVAAMLVVFVALGQALRYLPVADADRAVYDWVEMHQFVGAIDATQFATDLGSWGLRWWLGPAAAVVLGVRYRQAWWVPSLAIAMLFLLERGVQKYVGMLTQRPLLEGLAPYPSGGTGRVLSFAGLLFLLWLRQAPQTSRTARVTGWTVVVCLGVFEGWTRLYLNVHWATDVPPGLAFGGAALAVTALATAHLPRPATVPAAARVGLAPRTVQP